MSSIKYSRTIKSTKNTEILPSFEDIDIEMKPYHVAIELPIQEELLLKVPEQKISFQMTVRNYMINEGKIRIFFIAYLLGTIASFSWYAYYYNNNPNYVTIRNILKETLPIARGSAGALFLNCGIILFPVCRNSISVLRRTFLNSFVPFDKNIKWHKSIGVMIAIFTTVHIGAHVINALRYSSYYSTYTPEYLVLTNPSMLSGVAVIIIFFLIITSSLEPVRRSNFEIFWYTHHLFPFFFIMLIVHGQFCFIQGDRDPKCNPGGQFWKWFILSGFIYTTERLYREIRVRRLSYISKLVLHPSKVLEVQIKKPSCRTQPGQWIFLNCPELNRYQYHPFTLTNAPEQPFISVHMRMAGDWTNGFAKKMGITFTDSDGKAPLLGVECRAKLPEIRVDGPFGSASEDVFQYEVAMLFGAGIGVTPFASILKSIWFRVCQPTRVMKLRKVYFYWICRDKEAFEWFQDLLSVLEREDLENFLNITVYLTGELKPHEMRNVLMHSGEEKDPVTNLKSPTIYGRPNFDAVFYKIQQNHPSTKVGVMFCGPKRFFRINIAISKALHICCNKYSSSNRNGTQFFYGKENF
eukprot:NODE_11_length_46995_cov_0.451872.p8 type:complete len:580 gc:universal NODE_11_length_46995_cov_0.451872:29362-27623(-)